MSHPIGVTFARRKSLAGMLVGISTSALICFSGQAEADDEVSSSSSSPQATCPAGGQCFADVPPGNTFYAFANNLYKQDIITGYACGGAGEPCDDQNRPYYRPGSDVTRAQMSKFVDNARHLPGINIDTETDPQPIFANTGAETGIALEGIHGAFTGIAPGVRGATSSFSVGATGVLGVVVPTNPGSSSAGVRGINNSTSSNGAGVEGSHAGDGAGVRGSSATGIGISGATGGTDTTAAGVFGLSSGSGKGVAGLNNSQSGSGSGVSGIHQGPGYGVSGSSVSGVGVYGYSSANSGIGVFGSNPNGYAGSFLGDVSITGTCTGCTGLLKIDDPLDPANKYLYHSSVESPDMKNIYDGIATLDANGEAVIALPDYFQALNRDFRYQMAPIGASMPDLYIAEKVENNHFKIAGGKPGMEVSWQVTGIRNDPYSAQQTVPVEQDKPEAERGLYVHPDAYGQPDSKQVGQLPLP